MIIYKPKLVKHRRDKLQALLNELVQFKKDNDHDGGKSLKDKYNLDAWDNYKYKYATSDILYLKKLINDTDLTAEIPDENILNKIGSHYIYNEIQIAFR